MPNIILIQNDYPDASVLLNVLNYAFRSGMIGGYALDPNEAYRQMMMVKEAYHKTGGDTAYALHYQLYLCRSISAWCR